MGGSDEKVGEGEAYMRESDPDKVLDHAPPRINDKIG